MIRENLFYKVLSVIHIVFFTSILCFGIIFLSGTLLILPAFGAAFMVGKDYLYQKLDITDSIIRTYLRYFRSSLKLMKYIPVNILLLLNVAGMLAVVNTEGTLFSQNRFYGILCLLIIALLMTFIIYIAGYYTFVESKFQSMDVIFGMFVKLYYVLPVFVVMVLCIVFFSGILMLILMLTGTFLLFALEVLVFIQMLHYRKLLGKLENDEFEYLINRQPSRQK